MTLPGTLAPRRVRPLVVALVVAIAALIAAAVIVTLLVTSKKTPISAAAAPPVIANIPRPDAACTPADDRKLGPGDDLSSILFIGYIDGQRKEMIVGEALSQAVAGHKVEYVWYCPLRSQWH